MSEYKIIVSFPGFDFDPISPKSLKCPQEFEAILSTSDDNIEIKISFNHKTDFGRKISMWLMRKDWTKFGKYFSIHKIISDDDLINVDFSQTSLLDFSYSNNFGYSEYDHFVLKIDAVKLFFNPLEGEINTAEFYLNDHGFELVKNYYTPLFGWENTYSFKRMKGREKFYKFNSIKFRPEFNFSVNDKRENSQAVVFKEPKLQFYYNDIINEDDALKFTDVICLLASFYFHTTIDYDFSRIHLKQYSVVLRKIHKKSYKEPNGSLLGFGNQWIFHIFLNSCLKKDVFKNYKKLRKIVELFNQSHLVNNTSCFLLRFNILVICMNGNQKNELKFKYKLEPEKISDKYDKALQILIKTVNIKERDDFSKKWKSLKDLLVYRPLKSPLISLFEKVNLNIHDFPISINKLIELRNNIIHGSIDKVKDETVIIANNLLYKINGILILDMLGIKDYKFNP